MTAAMTLTAPQSSKPPKDPPRPRRWMKVSTAPGWEKALKHFLDTGKIPWDWVTYRGEPRCAACGIKLLEDEISAYRPRKIPGCSKHLEMVHACLDELSRVDSPPPPE